VARAVPVHRIRRLLHVVPDFADLAERHGYDAAPAPPDALPEHPQEMRYFSNGCYPWQAS